MKYLLLILLLISHTLFASSAKEVFPAVLNSNSITTLPPFKFFPTTNKETLALNKKRKTFKQSHVPSLVITNSKTELVFKAPKNSNGKRVQHIGTILFMREITT